MAVEIAEFTWCSAERLAAMHMVMLGYRDAMVTEAGTDRAIDVKSSGALAQVKFLTAPVGALAVQAFRGASYGTDITPARSGATAVWCLARGSGALVRCVDASSRSRGCRGHKILRRWRRRYNVTKFGWNGQVKNYGKKPVGVEEVRSLVGVCAVAGRRAAMFTSSTFTSDGLRFAEEADVVLFRYDSINGVLSPANALAKQTLTTGFSV